MTAASATRTGIKRLSEVAQHVIQPEGIKKSGWADVERTCRELGIEFDEWQRGAGRLILAKTVDGIYAATVGGVGMSLPRQCGKTYLLCGMLFALCILEPGLMVIWTAHHSRTAGETFLAMQGFAARDSVKPHVDAIYRGSGDEEIRFVNGSRILFGARERGFGRGFSGVDLLMCDEAQIFTDRALDNMLATLNTAPNPLALFVGTPPKPDDPSDMFRRMRLDALSGEATDVVWIECGAPEGVDPDDRKVWARANPSYPHRTPLSAMLRLRKKLTLESWLREGLGVWESQAVAAFDIARWAARPLLDRDVAPPGRVALVVDVAPDRSWSTIGVAGDNADGKTVVLCHSGRGTDWVTGKVIELMESRDVAEVALFTGGQARALQPDFVRAGIEYVKLSNIDCGAACAAFQQAVKAKSIRHVGQPELDAAVAAARTRRVGEHEMFDRREPGVDISPLVAVSGAFWRYGLIDSPLPQIW